MSAIRFEGLSGRVIELRRPTKRAASTGIAHRLSVLLREWRKRAKDRAELGRLDDRTLADIGVTRAEAEFLANRPFWRE